MGTGEGGVGSIHDCCGDGGRRHQWNIVVGGGREGRRNKRTAQRLNRRRLVVTWGVHCGEGLRVCHDLNCRR